MSEKNRILRPDEVGRQFLSVATKTVANMPVRTVKKFAAMKSAHPGINGAIAVYLCLAARERLAKDTR